ncbi:S-adenosylmethionine-dependentmethyltransferase [Plectosphaerella plurivora]|uniref:Protein-lysine N-methyltransferase EFM4 n=1 Tax=Plectosphaerella plurivora TaxID=936078 RepID=A0A9P9A6C7_9PEZI|nr:S-adenosylmethionine-dependentmethyltransferase [Plectosphaerella plurivora]
MASAQPTHLEPSKLGTREYWDSLYTTEITNHAADPTDEGTVWFDDSDAEARTLAFLDGITESASFDHEIRREDASFLDLGCGNGSLLFALRDDGWRTGRMLGVDYSARSVELARQIARARKEGHRPAKKNDDDDEEETSDEEEDDTPMEGVEEEKETEIEFAEWDVLRGSYEVPLSGAQSSGWDVVLDKGTFDAICLSDEKDAATGARACEGYKARVLRLVRPGGLFLVTSCNWTEEELGRWFQGPAGDVGSFAQVDRINYPSFQFGGAKGQTISTLCFRREA